jgi:hypothetical protein
MSKIKSKHMFFSKLNEKYFFLVLWAFPSIGNFHLDVAVDAVVGHARGMRHIQTEAAFHYSARCWWSADNEEKIYALRNLFKSRQPYDLLNDSQVGLGVPAVETAYAAHSVRRQ